MTLGCWYRMVLGDVKLKVDGTRLRSGDPKLQAIIDESIPSLAPRGW